jgi:hypothetical protein
VPEEDELDPHDAADEPTEEEPEVQISADTFIGFAASWWRLARVRFGPIFIAFFIGNLLVYATLLTLSRTASAGSAVGILFFTGQFLLTAVVGGLLATASGYVRLEAMFSRRQTMRDGIRFVGDMWGHIIGSSLLTGLLAALLLLAIGLLGLFLGLPLRLGPPVLLFVIAFEKYSLTSAWSRTSALIKGNALRTFMYLLMLVLMSMVVLLLVQRLLDLLLDQISLTDLSAALVFTGVTVVLYALLDVALSAGLLVTYADVRKREDEDFSIDELTEEPEGDDASR